MTFSLFAPLLLHRITQWRRRYPIFEYFEKLAGELLRGYFELESRDDPPACGTVVLADAILTPTREPSLL